MKLTISTSPKINRVYLMAIFGRERKPRAYPKKRWDHVYSNAREWWIVEAPTANHARAVCMLWPLRATTEWAKITDHRRKPRP